MCCIIAHIKDPGEAVPVYWKAITCLQFDVKIFFKMQSPVACIRLKKKIGLHI